MSRTLSIALLALLILPSTAARASPPSWGVFGGAGVFVYGPSGAPTVALMPEIGVGKIVASGEDLRFSVSASVGGFVADGILGALGGPALTLEGSPAKRLWVSGSVGLDLGSLPVCNQWGFCGISYMGLYPQAAIGVSYAVSGTWRAQAALRSRYFSTLGWEGISWQPALLVVTDI